MEIERPKILCLGVSYASIEAQLAKRGHTLALLDNAADGCKSTNSTEAAIECVQRKILTQMDGRDLARCLATEDKCNVDVYCVSQEKGAIYRPDRHFDANFNRASFVNALKKHFEGCQFDQIVLDYFWIPTGWDIAHWNKSFFDKTLIAFAKVHLLRNLPSSPALFNGKYRRGIFLPFCLHCFKAIVSHGNELKKYFNISFLRKNELDCLALWSGTQSIGSSCMQHILGKRIDQEEIYCTFGSLHINGMEAGSVSKEELIELASSLENFPDIRFMVLEPLLPALECDGVASDGKTAYGRFLGLVNPSEVKRGFRHVDPLIRPSTPIPSPRTKPNAATANRRKRAAVFQVDREDSEKRSNIARYPLRSNRSPTTVVLDPATSSEDNTAATPMQPKVIFQYNLRSNRSPTSVMLDPASSPEDDAAATPLQPKDLF